MAEPGARRQNVPPRPPWTWIALLAGIACAAAAALGAPGNSTTNPVAVSWLHDAAGLIYLVVGAVAWHRRPHNRTGMLMTVAGLAWFLVDLKEVPSSVLFTTGDLLGNVVYGVIAQLGLSFPSGHLQSARERLVVEITYLWVTFSALLPVVFAPQSNCTCIHDLLDLHPDASAYQVAQQLQEIGNVLVAILVVALVIRHRIRATPPARRAMAPVIWASGPILFIVVALNGGVTALPDWVAQLLPALTPIALATLPIAFVVGLVRSRLASLAVGNLVVELTSSPPGDQFRDAIARTLGDEKLRLAYFVSEGWVDHQGASLQLPHDDSPQTFTLLERDGVPIAALIHDRSLQNDPTLVAEVAAASALAIENERLKVELLARLSEVRESRARLVEVADVERRKLERDLHDGAQQRLVSVGMTLGRASEGFESGDTGAAKESVLVAARDLQSALGELRELAAGIRPAILTDAGLGPALEALFERSPIPVTFEHQLDRRCSDAVEAAAYYAVSEATTNVAKHAHAKRVTVTAKTGQDRLEIEVSDDGVGGVDLSGGTGIRGLQDRLTALDGSLSISSRPDGGTEMKIGLPCE